MSSIAGQLVRWETPHALCGSCESMVVSPRAGGTLARRGGDIPILTTCSCAAGRFFTSCWPSALTLFDQGLGQDWAELFTGARSSRHVPVPQGQPAATRSADAPHRTLRSHQIKRAKAPHIGPSWSTIGACACGTASVFDLADTWGENGLYII